MATIYWAVYPSAQADPTATEIINGTVPNGFFGSDTAPTGNTVDFTGAAITGLAASTSYKLAGVWSDAANDSNVDITAAFLTLPAAVPTNVTLQNSVDITLATPATTVEFTQDVTLQNSVDVNITTPAVDVDAQIDTNVDLQNAVVINITTPAVEVVEFVDTNVDLQNSVDINIVTPAVNVTAGLDVTVDLLNSVSVNITTPAVDVAFFQFTNVVLQNSVDVNITTPAVEVVEFVDTNVEPTTVQVNITTPNVDVVEGLDINIDLQNSVDINITTPAVDVTQTIDYLQATEIDPLEYTVSIGGTVELVAVDEVFAWMNEQGVVNTPFPAIWNADLPNRSAASGGTAGWTADVRNAGGYQWYIDYDPLIGETGPTLLLSPITLGAGTYEVSCVAINPQGNGIRSNIATLTVT